MVFYCVEARQSFKRGVIFRNTLLSLMRNPRRPKATRSCSYWHKEGTVWYLHQDCLCYFYKLILKESIHLAPSTQRLSVILDTSKGGLRKTRKQLPFASHMRKKVPLLRNVATSWALHVSISGQLLVDVRVLMPVGRHLLCNVFLPSRIA